MCFLLGSITILRSLIRLCRLSGFYVALDGIARKDPSRARFTKEQEQNISALKAGCEALLEDLQMHLQEFEYLGRTSKGFRLRTEKVYKKIAWDASVVDQLRARITSNTGLLISVNMSIARSAILPQIGESFKSRPRISRLTLPATKLIF